MPSINNSKLSKAILLGAISLSLVGGFSFILANQAKSHRLPASKQTPIVENNKSYAPIQATLEVAGDIPDKDEDFVEVKAIVTGRVDILEEGFHFRWKLPQDSVADFYPLEGDSQLATNGAQIISLRLNHFSKETFSQLTFQVEGNGDESVANSAILVSREEDTWEHIAPDMQKAADELQEQ